MGVADATDVREAAHKAGAAQRDWGEALATDRAEVLRRAAELLRKHQEEVKRWVMRECGGFVRRLILNFSRHMVTSHPAPDCGRAANTETCFIKPRCLTEPAGDRLPRRSEQGKLGGVYAMAVGNAAGSSAPLPILIGPRHQTPRKP